MHMKRVIFFFALLCVHISFGCTTQNPSREKNNKNDEDESNPLFDMASLFVQEAFNNQNSRNGGSAGTAGAGLAAVASLFGTLMQDNQGKAMGSGAVQILSGIGSLLANTNAGNGHTKSGGGLDASIISNVIEMFTGNDDSEAANSKAHSRSKRGTESGIGLESIMQIASAFMGNNGAASKRSFEDDSSNAVETEDKGLSHLLPLAMQAISSFVGAEGQHTQEKHKDHAWVLPPFLEHIHVLWDHFSHSELADALYEKSGVNKILKGFKGRDGKVDYDKLFDSLNNQSFRRRWIKSAILYLADWTSYLANPEVYRKYLQTAQLMFNGFLKTQGYPKTTFFDPSRPGETISHLLDHVAKHHLNVKIHSGQYVKLGVGYAEELLKLGQARGLLQFNATEISDKLTDTLNLEVIEPVLKVHRAYRFISKNPHCDRYVLCQLNSVEPMEEQKHQGLISGVSPNIVKVGSMGAAFFISTETGTPFWTLFGAISSPHICDIKYPVDCSGFHEGEAKVTTEYIHNEL